MVIDQNRVNLLLTKADLVFEDALFLLRCGYKMHRTNWVETQYIELQKPDEQSKMKRAYLFAVPKDGQAFPYTVSNLDIFMSDWQVFKV